MTADFCGLEWMTELKGDGLGVVEVVFVVVWIGDLEMGWDFGEIGHLNFHLRDGNSYCIDWFHVAN